MTTTLDPMTEPRAERTSARSVKRCLRRDEIDTIREALGARPKSKNARLQRVLFELGISTGLRASEMVKLQVRDVQVSGRCPKVYVRNGKGGKERESKVHNPASADVLRAWKVERAEMGAKPTDPFLCTIADGTDEDGNPRAGKPQDRQRLGKRFKSLLRCLEDEERESVLSIHALRHTFASHLWARTKPDILVVQRALGHADPRTTTIYIHSLDTDEAPIDILAEDEPESADERPSTEPVDVAAALREEIRAELRAEILAEIRADLGIGADEEPGVHRRARKRKRRQ